MAGNVLKATEAVANNPELLEKLRAASSPAEKRQVLADAGFSGFTPDQAEVLRKAQGGTELSDEDLQQLADVGTTTVVSSIVHVSEIACEDVADALA
jgi:predicted ribosomally synthesized peptide with nif11-like leader